MRRAEEHIYTATTDDVRVSVAPSYVEEESRPERGRFVWSYTVQVENMSTSAFTLINRHWKITDATGKLEEVKGEGVIGQQPTLNPGQAFQYSSWCVLKTPSGIMAGTYEMQTSEGSTFPVEIPAFSLDIPDTIHAVH